MESKQTVPIFYIYRSENIYIINISQKVSVLLKKKSLTLMLANWILRNELKGLTLESIAVSMATVVLSQIKKKKKNNRIYAINETNVSIHNILPLFFCLFNSIVEGALWSPPLKRDFIGQFHLMKLKKANQPVPQQIQSLCVCSPTRA